MATNNKRKRIPKSTEAHIEERRNLITEYLRQKMSYDDMLVALRGHPLQVTSKDTISKDVNAIFSEWRKMRVTDVDDLRLTELARLFHIIDEANTEWEKSKTRKRTKVKYVGEKIDDTGKPRTGVRPDEIEVVTFQPERQYLETMIKASERICKMLGVDMPIKIAPTTPEGEALGVVALPAESENGEVKKNGRKRNGRG